MPLNPPQAYRKTEFTHRRGERIAQPLASDVLIGTLYFVIDEGIIEISDGTNWQMYVGQGANVSNLVNYSYSTATGTPPGANQVRFNAGFPYTAVTKLYFWNITSDGQNIKVGLLRVQPGAVIYIQKKNDATQWASFQVTTDPIDNTTWTEFDVVHINHGSSILGGQLVLVQAGPGPTYTPPAHAPTHETGGSDALAHLSAAILDSGLLPDARLNNTAVTPASYGDAGHISQFTVDAHGRLTAAANVTFFTSAGWTAVDASGAGLAFVTSNATYFKISNQVFFMFQVQYPVTASGANAIVGGLPFTVGALNYVAYQGFGVQRMWIIPASTTNVAALDPATSAPITNAQLSGTIILVSGRYET